MRTSALSQEEVDQLVVSQANDPKAWGYAVNVRPFGVSRNSLALEDKCLYTPRVSFEWDPEKAASNLIAHGVRFAEATTVFEDTFALTREDPAAAEEQRFVTLGLSNQTNLLVVIYTYRAPDIVRVISAWRAGKRERDQYEESRSS